MNNKTIVCVFIILFYSIHDVNGKTKLNDLENHSIYYGLLMEASKQQVKQSDCIRKLSRTEEGLRNGEVWALKLLDASGSPSTGIYWGNSFWLGSRTQCYSAYKWKRLQLSPDRLIDNLFENPEHTSAFPVNYYAAYFNHSSDFQVFIDWKNERRITLGLCLPATCYPNEISKLLQEYFNTQQLFYQKLYNSTLTVEGVKKLESKIDVTDPMVIILIVWILLIVIMCILGTIYDQSCLHICRRDSKLINDETKQITRELNDRNAHVNEGSTSASQKQQSNKDVVKYGIVKKILVGFSVLSNLTEVCSTKKGKNSLAAINGIRFFALSFIIVTHCNLYTTDYLNNRPKSLYDVESIVGQLFQNSWYLVDVFFFLGGFLMVYSLSKSKDLSDISKPDNRNLIKIYIKFIFKRFARLTPVYLFVILVAHAVSSFMSKNSVYWTNERNDFQCKQFWWTNIFYINNIYPGTWDTMCMSWTWYLACDMQFFVTTSGLYILSKKYFKTGTYLAFLIMFVSFALLASTTHLTGYRPYANSFYPTAPVVYYPPWMRINPYIVGAIFCYFFKNFHGKITHINKICVGALWIISSVTVIYIMVGFGDRAFGPVLAIIHTTFFRTIFVIAVGWMLLACLTGHGGFVNTILSLNIWLPLSSLTYSAYLIHPVIIAWTVMDMEGSWSFENSGILITSVGLLWLTYVISLILVITVEMPADKFLNILLEIKSSKTNDKEKNHAEEVREDETKEDNE